MCVCSVYVQQEVICPSEILYIYIIRACVGLPLPRPCWPQRVCNDGLKAALKRKTRLPLAYVLLSDDALYMQYKRGRHTIIPGSAILFVFYLFFYFFHQEYFFTPFATRRGSIFLRHPVSRYYCIKRSCCYIKATLPLSPNVHNIQFRYLLSDKYRKCV